MINELALDMAFEEFIREEQDGPQREAIAAAIRVYLAIAPQAPSWKCKANRTAIEPEDCNWPLCGCDPYADKVIASLEESGVIIALQEPVSAIPTANCCNCGRIVDTRETKDGGDPFGIELNDGRWVCSGECWDVVVDDLPQPPAQADDGKDAEIERLGKQCEGLAQAAMNNGQSLLLAEELIRELVAALVGVLECPSMADGDHNNLEWGCEESAKADSVARAIIARARAAGYSE
jgi:hypothetical protein